MRKYRLWITAAAVLLICMFFGFWIVQGRPDDTRYTVAFVGKSPVENSDFWTSVRSGMEMAAEEYGVELTCRYSDAETNWKEQNEILRDVMKEHPNAILLAPASYTETIPVMEEIKSEGIQLVLVDSEVESQIQDAVVATDNMEAGKKLGTYVRQLMRDKEGSIAIIGHVRGVSTAIEREAGFREGLQEREKDIVDVVFCDSKYEVAYEEASKLIQTHPDLKVIAGLNEYSTIGAARAVRDLGKQGQIYMVGIDSSMETITMLEAHVVTGIIIQKPFNMGYIAMEDAVKLIQGKPVEKRTNSGTKLITRSNLNVEENQKILFPFDSKQ